MAHAQDGTKLEPWLLTFPSARLNFAAQVGQQISTRRKELGWSQKKLAELWGVSREHISRIESGQAEINAGDIPRMAMALNVSVAYLYSGVPSSSNSLPSDPLEDDLLNEFRRLPNLLRKNVLDFVRNLNNSFAEVVKRSNGWDLEEKYAEALITQEAMAMSAQVPRVPTVEKMLGDALMENMDDGSDDY